MCLVHGSTSLGNLFIRSVIPTRMLDLLDRYGERSIIVTKSWSEFLQNIELTVIILLNASAPAVCTCSSVYFSGC